MAGSFIISPQGILLSAANAAFPFGVRAADGPG